VTTHTKGRKAFIGKGGKKMKFKIIDLKDGSDVLGGEISEENSHLTINMADGRDKYKLLNIGESINAKFCCSSKSGWYKVLRVE
jgi:hypothetical protein